MYKELEYFSGATGKAILYRAVLNPISKAVKDTKTIMVDGQIVFIENIRYKFAKPIMDAKYVLVVENYATKEFVVKKFESEKHANAVWHDCVRKISQSAPNTKQR